MITNKVKSFFLRQSKRNHALNVKVIDVSLCLIVIYMPYFGLI